MWGCRPPAILKPWPAQLCSNCHPLTRTCPHPPARYEEDQAALRALRMALRDLTYRLLSNRKWEWFAEPEEDPEWWEKVRAGWLGAAVLAGQRQAEWWWEVQGGWRLSGGRRRGGAGCCQTAARAAWLGSKAWCGRALPWRRLDPTTTPHRAPCRTQVTRPMDLATLLANVNARVYATPQQFLADVALIPQVGAGLGGRAGGGRLPVRLWSLVACD